LTAGEEDKAKEDALGELSLPEIRCGKSEDHAPYDDENSEEDRVYSRLSSGTQVVAGPRDDKHRERGLTGEINDEGGAISGRRDVGVDVDKDRRQRKGIGQPGQHPQTHLSQLDHLPQEQKVTEHTDHHCKLNGDRQTVEGGDDFLHV